MHQTYKCIRVVMSCVHIHKEQLYLGPVWYCLIPKALDSNSTLTCKHKWWNINESFNGLFKVHLIKTVYTWFVCFFLCSDNAKWLDSSWNNFVKYVEWAVRKCVSSVRAATDHWLYLWVCTERRTLPRCSFNSLSHLHIKAHTARTAGLQLVKKSLYSCLKCFIQEHPSVLQRCVCVCEHPLVSFSHRRSLKGFGLKVRLQVRIREKNWNYSESL